MSQKTIVDRSSFAIVIMAAGKGTRLKSRRAKVLHEIGGRPLLAHVIASALQAAQASDIYVIVGHQAGAVRAAVADMRVQFVEQAEQRGTGHAVMCARPHLEAERYRDILVLSGDVPLIRPETIRRVRDFQIARKAAMTILTAEPASPLGYGRIVRAGGDRVKAIVEQKDLSRSQEKIREINSGVYAFAAKPLFANIDKLTTNNANGEFYLTDMAALLVRARNNVVAIK